MALGLHLLPLCAAASLLTSPPPRTRAVAKPYAPDTVHVSQVYERVLTASELLNTDGSVTLTAEDLATARRDMHLEEPASFLPPGVFATAPVDVTELVRTTLPQVLEAHPIFAFMAEETVMANDDWHESVYFGTAPRGADALGFPALCRRVVATIYLFELLLGQERDAHRALAQHYEARYATASARSRAATHRAPVTLRQQLLGFFLAVKGESVLASINAFEELRRLGGDGRTASPAAIRELSDTLNAIMSLNIFEAVLSNLSFAYWPDNARAGMALLLAPRGAFNADLTQDLTKEWFTLYLAWNANFIWPSHFYEDMLCFTMLLTPSIALGPPGEFQYRRAHTLLWVVRSAQLTTMARAAARAAAEPAGGAPPTPEQLPCFRCRQLEPPEDRQPLTSRTAVLTRASGEALARASGDDVSEGSGVWKRLATEVVPQQVGNLVRIWRRMPKDGPFKLTLL